VDLSNIIVPADLKPKPLVTCVIEGHLEESDLRELALSTQVAMDEDDSDDDPTRLKKIREKHHSIARMIAGGLTQRMVSQLCGYTEGYVSILLNNPAIKELIELYRIQQGSAAAVVTEKMRTVGLKAVEKLEKKIEAGELSNQELLGAAKLGLDRGGHGPQSKQHVVNETHLFDHTELARRNQAARTRSASRIVRSSEVRGALAPPTREIEVEADRNVEENATRLYEPGNNEQQAAK
jgi:hypothetical protein